MRKNRTGHLVKTKPIFRRQLVRREASRQASRGCQRQLWMKGNPGNLKEIASAKRPGNDIETLICTRDRLQKILYKVIANRLRIKYIFWFMLIPVT